MKKLFLFLTGCFILGAISILSYNFSNYKYNNIEEAKDIVEIDEQLKEIENNNNDKNKTLDLQNNISETGFLQDDNTKKENEFLDDDIVLVFIKRYKDGSTVTDERALPNHFIGKDKKYLQNYFDNYVITSFSDEKVVFEREVNNESYFLIGEDKGFVTVFLVNYDESVDIYEKLDTPTESLSENDQKLLKQGVRCNDKNSLFLALENYES